MIINLIKKTACAVVEAGVTTIVSSALGSTIYVVCNKPSVVTNPCRRTFYREDGVPKKAFDTAWRANLQVVKQLFLHGEVCNPYQANGKYYTGHSKYAPIKSINPFKK